MDRNTELAEHMQNIIDTDLLALVALATKYEVPFDTLLDIQINALTAGHNNDSVKDTEA